MFGMFGVFINLAKGEDIVYTDTKEDLFENLDEMGIDKDDEILEYFVTCTREELEKYF